MATKKTTAKPKAKPKAAKSKTQPKTRAILPAQMIHRPSTKMMLFIALALILIGTAWYVLQASRTANNLLDGSLKNAQSQSTGTLHSSDEAVQAVKDMYAAYLPLKADIAAEVGESIDVEPANVQVIRASETYFGSDFYDQVLADYMREFQATSHVTADAVTCNSDAGSVSAVVINKKAANSVTVQVTLVSQSGITTEAQVTVDLHTLKVMNVACMQTKEN